MTDSIIFFETVEELEQLVGLNREELYGRGFNLDNMDWGFVADHKWYTHFSFADWLDEDNSRTVNDWYGLSEDEQSELYNRNNDKMSRYSSFILDRMYDYCLGYREVEYNGKWYYTLHHA